ncbi:MAG: hypothetical protein JXA74_11095 [Anaerolineae bacterium]|nr:hypothetical protein [Anaerolineae bacterium]
MYVQHFVNYPKPGRWSQNLELAKTSPPMNVAGYTWRVMTPRYGHGFVRKIVADQTYESFDERERGFSDWWQTIEDSGWWQAFGEAVAEWSEDLFWVLRDVALKGDPGPWLMRLEVRIKAGAMDRAIALVKERPLPELPGLTFRALLPLSGPDAHNYLVEEWGFGSLDAYYSATMAFAESEAGKAWLARWTEVAGGGSLHELYQIRS